MNTSPWKDTHCGVVGLGVSNRGALSYLYTLGVRQVTCRSREPIDRRTLPPFPSLRIITGQRHLCDIDEDVLFLSPSVRPDGSPLLLAKEHGTRLSSDAHLFFESTRAACFAITGSDGKSTTTKIAELLLKTGQFSSARACGNIGISLCAQLATERATDAYAIELSSFQLMTLSPAVCRAAITNISENHLDWHKDLAEYVQAKGHIFEHASDTVLNADDARICALHREKTPFAVYSTSLSEQALARRASGAVVYLSDGCICVNGRRVLPIERIAMRARFAVQNYMCAIALTYGYADALAVEDIASTFHGLPHRMQPVATKHGVSYVDSSIDSSPCRTAATLSSFSAPVILIVCGRDKHLSPEPLYQAIRSHVKALVCTGEFGRKVYEESRVLGGIPVYLSETLTDAVRTAAACATQGDTVLLSPGATSFDAFQNFEARGRAFCDAVASLP